MMLGQVVSWDAIPSQGRGTCQRLAAGHMAISCPPMSRRLSAKRGLLWREARANAVMTGSYAGPRPRPSHGGPARWKETAHGGSTCSWRRCSGKRFRQPRRIGVSLTTKVTGPGAARRA